MAFPRTISLPLSIYLLWTIFLSTLIFLSSAFSPLYAAEPSPAKKRSAPSGRSWRFSLSHASALLRQAGKAGKSGNQVAMALMAAQDCRESLAQQKSPQGYQLLSVACLMAGSAHKKEALAAGRDLIEASAGSADMADVVVLAAFYNGDFSFARQVLATYTGDEVRISHPEAHAIMVGALTRRGAGDLAMILAANPLSNDVRGQARKMLLEALVEFFHQNYGSVTTIAKRYHTAFGLKGFSEENDFAETLTVCANLLILRPDRARAHALLLLDRPVVDPSTPVLVDTVYYSMNQREEGLKQILQREPKSERVCKLGRVWILDEMSQPRDALNVLNDLARKLPADAEVLLQRAKMEAELNENDLALKHLDQYLSSNRKSGQGYILRAQIYVQKKQWQKALADLNSAVDCGYGLVKAVRARSACYSALGRKDLSQNDLNLAESFMQWVR